MFGNIYGLDLGTYEIKVFDKKQDKICRERDVIAIKNKKNIFPGGSIFSAPFFNFGNSLLDQSDD